MPQLTESQLRALAAEHAYRQREIRRNIFLSHPAIRWDAHTSHEHRPTVQNVSVKFPDWSFDDDTPANYDAEDPISFFGIKEVV